MQKGNTNWNLYRVFVAAYEHKNYHNAAKFIGTTPSAVGQNMRQLGNQLGVTLFTSHPKGAEPTKDADSIYPKIKSAVEAIVSAENDVSKSINQNKTIVRMALANASVELLVKNYVKEFRAEHPDIKLEISKLDDMDLVQQKQQDFVIAAKHCIDPNFKIVNLYKGTPSFIATKEFLKKHGLSSTISTEQLFKLPVVMRKGAGSFANLDKQLGIQKMPRTSVSVASSDMVYFMTQGSEYIGFFSKEVLKLVDEANNGNFVVLNIGNTNFQTLQYVFGYSENLTESARIFIEGFSKFCKNKLGQN